MLRRKMPKKCPHRLDSVQSGGDGPTSAMVKSGRRPAFEIGQAFNIINMRTRKPVIGVPADRRLLGSHWFHCVGEKYLAAIADASDALPLIVPAFGERLELELLLECCDGVLLTGSPSNVEPHHYAGPASAPGTWHDPERDATTLPLIPRAVAVGLPLLAICRGFQELNVAYGGTLHQKLHEVPGLPDAQGGRDAAARDAVRPGARHPADERRRCWRGSPAASRSRSTRCTRRASTASEAASRSRAGRRTASSRRCGSPTRRASPSRCSGTRNGRSSRTISPRHCSPRSVTRPGPTHAALPRRTLAGES